MASADWARLYRLSLYLLCELHPSRSLALSELHFPMRAAFTLPTHSLTHSLTYWCDEKSRVNQSYLRVVWSAV